MTDSERSADEGEATSLSFGGRFRVRRTLGRGASGAVYLVHDTVLDEDVALKALHAGRAADPESMLRFRREVKLARRITHQHVARIFDLAVDFDPPFLTMEFVDGESLRDVLESRGPLPADECIDIALAICDGLDAAHRVDVIHRDLKPENVLVDREGRIVITDFGIATTLDGDDVGQFIGTPAYAAPEQAGCVPIDPRADIYALGTMIYEMLADVCPFEGNPLQIVTTRMVRAAPPLPADVDSALNAVVRRCLERDPAERFATAGELASALRDASAGVSAPPAPPTNLAYCPDAFVGRGPQLADLERRLTTTERRFVTVLGAGGSGKTRLVREVGRCVREEFPGGVWFVDLTHCDGVEGVVTKLGSVLNVPIRGDEGVEVAGRVIRARGRVLVILDGLEHVAHEAGACIESWTEIAPEARFLVTSRVKLGAPAERVCRLGPLEVASATRLFAQRARRVRSDFVLDDETAPLVQAIVERVDRLPLAIELAAAQLHRSSPAQLLDRLRDRFESLRIEGPPDSRHSTMRSVIDDSWALLSEGARATLAQLSVFRGGAPLATVFRVVEDRDGAPLEDVLEELWDHSFIQWARTGVGDRVEWLPMIADYAARHLTDAAVVEKRHAAAMLELCRGASIHVLALERANLVAACVRSVEARRPDEAVALARELYRLFLLRGGARLALLRAVVEVADSVELRLRSLMLLGDIAIGCGHLDQAASALLEGLELSKTGHHPASELGFLGGLTTVSWRNGELDEALRYGNLALQHPELDAHLEERAGVLVPLGLVHNLRGESAQAISCLDRAVRIHQKLGDRRAEGRAVADLAVVRFDAGDIAGALDGFEEALSLHRECGDLLHVALSLSNFGTAFKASGDVERARSAWSEALALCERTGDERSRAVLQLNLGAVEVEHGDVAYGRELLQAALPVLRSKAVPRAAAFAEAALAAADIRRGDDMSAKSRMSSAERELRAFDDTQAIARIYCMQGIAYARRGDFELARAILDDVHAMIDVDALALHHPVARHVRELEGRSKVR